MQEVCNTNKANQLSQNLKSKPKPTINIFWLRQRCKNTQKVNERAILLLPSGTSTVMQQVCHMNKVNQGEVRRA